MSVSNIRSWQKDIELLHNYEHSTDESAINKFHDETLVHMKDVGHLCSMIASQIEYKAGHHDLDKLQFRGDLQDWLKYFHDGHHFSGVCENSVHHKENVRDLLDVIEMLSDWVCASYRRTGSTLDPKTQRLPQLDWDLILRNTLELFVNLFNEYNK